MKQRHFKALTSLLLVVVMLASMLPAIPVTVNAAEETVTYTFSEYTAGTQYAKNEEHKLDDKLTVITNDCHFTTQLRIYSSSNNNGYAILKAADDLVISGFGMNAGYKKDTLNIYGSDDDGATWTQIDGVATTTTSYENYTADFSGESYKWLKLDVAGSSQIRVVNITVTFTKTSGGETPDTPTCEHTNQTTTTVDATCTEAGSITVTCDDCGKTVSSETIPALGHTGGTATCEEKARCTRCTELYGNLASHNYVDGACSTCGTKEPTGFYIAAIRSSGNYQFMTSNLGTASTTRYQATDSGLTTLPAEITNPTKGYVFKLEDAGEDQYYIIAVGVEGDNYLGWTSGNSGILVANGSAIKFTKTENNDGTVSFSFAASDATRYLALNGTSGNNYFAMYKSGQKQNLTLIPVVEGECKHTNTTTNTTPATCTTAGVESVVCNDCEVTISTTELPALNHNYDYATGECQECDAIAPVSVGDQIYLTANNHSVLLTGFDTDKSFGTVGALADAIIFEIEAGAVRGTHSFKYNGQYLAWETGNTLVLVDEKNEMASWIIEFADGTFKIVNSQSTDRVIKYNANDSRFSTYSNNTFPAVQIIKVPTAPAVSGWSVSLNAGTTIKVTCNVPTAWLADNPNATAAFVFENSAFAGSEPVALTAGVAEYTFTLAPKTLGETLYFVLTTDGVNEFGRIDVSYENYKTQQNTAITQNPTLNALVGAIDKYNAAANLDPEDDTIEITTESFTGVATWGKSEDALTKTDTDGIFVADSFSVTLGQQIAVNIGIDTSKDYSNCNIAVSINDGDPVVAGAFADYIIKEGMIVIKGFAPTNLNDKISITITGDYSASTSFKLNSYLQYIYNAVDEENNNAYVFSNYYRNMAAVTFQYGVAAEAYANNNQ